MVTSVAVGDLTPGQVRLSSLTSVSFSRWGIGEQEIPFEIIFSSEDFEFWKDTFFVRVYVPVGIAQLGEGLPADFALRQNYPNPLNPSTTITYELPRASGVRLSVFDMLGREVSVLVNERREAGVHKVRLDASRLASGVYIYRLQAGGFAQSRKFVVLW
jgi:hypothetical protein